MDEIMELITETSESQLVSNNEKDITPRVGMSSEKVKSSRSKPKILRVYSYDEMVEVEFNISHVETEF